MTEETKSPTAQEILSEYIAKTAGDAFDAGAMAILEALLTKVLVDPKITGISDAGMLRATLTILLRDLVHKIEAGELDLGGL
jgi:hypothetical protein